MTNTNAPTGLQQRNAKQFAVMIVEASIPVIAVRNAFVAPATTSGAVRSVKKFTARTASRIVILTIGTIVLTAKNHFARIARRASLVNNAKRPSVAIVVRFSGATFVGRITASCVEALWSVLVQINDTARLVSTSATFAKSP